MRGRQTPTFEAVGPSAYTEGDQAVLLASEYFDRPMEWQVFVVRRILERAANGKFAHHAIALSVPRQNGKSWVITVVCFYAMVVLGYKILYTCQNGDTSDAMFLALAAVFEDEENEDVHPLLDRVRRTNGQQGIYLLNGSFIRFTTRTDSLARGRSYDMLVYDEAQELTHSQQSASLPTISSSKKRDALTIYLGTPPSPGKDGFVFRMMHDRAHSADPGATAWIEWGVTEIGDVTDPARWCEANPSIGALVDETTVEGELAMTADDFARERLGWWDVKGTATRAIPLQAWEAGAIRKQDIPEKGKDALGVKFSADGSMWSLAACRVPDAGPMHVELIRTGDMASGFSELAGFLSDPGMSDRFAAVAVDGRSGTQSLLSRICEEWPRKAVAIPGARGVVDACLMFTQAVIDGRVSHWRSKDQGPLDMAVEQATRRPVGHDGGWAFDGSGCCHVEAVALAVWAAATTRRDPSGGSVIL